MWAEFMRLPNRYIAETWRELLHAEGVAVRLVVPDDRAAEGDLAPRTLLRTRLQDARRPRDPAEDIGKRR